MDIVEMLRNCADMDEHNCGFCPLYCGSFECITVLLQKAVMEIVKLRGD